MRIVQSSRKLEAITSVCDDVLSVTAIELVAGKPGGVT